MSNFFTNVLRYPLFLISFSLGIFLTFFRWIEPITKKPLNLIVLIISFGTVLMFLNLTFKAMLDLN
uniref:Uncharacterized protein ycf33 n=1 Tax=Cyanophora paradoxa TaxID=2762 RepID=YCF33_CYAPA|nr:hypothetical protein CypaCp117 [Cyanophora paradoxa]P48273.1 RecName: Full=Uncharacterized protein ycf33 [Cyanophora paradoxa]AAA81285.1 ycf33 [Cyanophora paradoxa]